MSTDARLTTVEHALAELAVAQARTQANVDRLVDEMRAFKDEMGAFKDEMRAFKDEMRAGADRSERERVDFRRQLGELSNKMGTLVEDIVFPSLADVFQSVFGGDRPPDLAIRVRRWHVTDPARQREFDAIASNSTVFLINETKSRVRPEDVPAFVETLAEARSFFPEAAGRRVVGALASFHVDPAVARAGERQGLLMLGLGGGLLEVLNAPGFTLREF
jgi:hypothetical protein